MKSFIEQPRLHRDTGSVKKCGRGRHVSKPLFKHSEREGLLLLLVHYTHHGIFPYVTSLGDEEHPISPHGGVEGVCKVKVVLANQGKLRINSVSLNRTIWNGSYAGLLLAPGLRSPKYVF